MAAAWWLLDPRYSSPHECPWSEVKWSDVKSLSHVRLFATPWTVAYKAPLSMEFSRQEYWSGLPFPSPGWVPLGFTNSPWAGNSDDCDILVYWYGRKYFMTEENPPICPPLLCLLGFPGGSDGKESTCNAGHLGLILGLGRFPWRRAWQPTPLFLPGECP